MNLSDIQYRYALDEKGAINDVLKLTVKDRKNYICIGCNHILRPVLGKTRKKHFRHKAVKECNKETYLHRMGVWLFNEAYQEALSNREPFTLGLPQKHVCTACGEGPCENQSKTVKDLTQTYTSAKEETFDTSNNLNFIPDILLFGNENKVYIEIVVSHKSSDKKINSKIPIIEIDIKTEEDLNLILDKNLPLEDNRIRRLNFPEIINEVNRSENCPRLAQRQRDEASIQNFKAKFKETYQKKLDHDEPILMGIKRPLVCETCEGGPCRNGEHNEIVNLAKNFSTIIEETATPECLGNRIAIQSNTGRKIYIETNKSIKCMPNEFQSDQMIVLNTDQEKHIFDLLKHPGRWGTGHKFRNLDPHTKYEDLSKNCLKKTCIFTINNIGKATLSAVPFFNFKLHKPEGTVYSKHCPKAIYDESRNFKNELFAAARNKIYAKNCLLCKHSQTVPLSFLSNPPYIYCPKKHQTLHPDKALYCELYIIGKKRAFRRTRKPQI